MKQEFLHNSIHDVRDDDAGAELLRKRKIVGLKEPQQPPAPSESRCGTRVFDPLTQPISLGRPPSHAAQPPRRGKASKTSSRRVLAATHSRWRSGSGGSHRSSQDPEQQRWDLPPSS